jgi:hypothetical protein
VNRASTEPDSGLRRYLVIPSQHYATPPKKAWFIIIIFVIFVGPDGERTQMKSILMSQTQ